MTGENNGEHRSTDQASDSGADQRADQGNTGAQDATADLAAEITRLRAELASLKACQGGVIGSPNPYGYGNYLTQLPMTSTMFMSNCTFMGGNFSGPPPAQALLHVKHDGIVAGEILAWRCWRVTKDNLLTSCAMAQFVWQPDEPTTGNVETWNEGVHAWKTRDDAIRYGRNECGLGTEVVFGQVKLWGEVIEFNYGYRAEFAKIVSLEAFIRTPYHPTWWSSPLKQLRKNYHV